ncbi:MAG: hypothetical protein M1820_004618 [Bogoriella megaspora]|nr:MAG: hypothetical protein M1820_004618 [Bogoriella megaspora]
MEPLSVAASIVGLIGIAGKISAILVKFYTVVKNAPSLAGEVSIEITHITASLNQLNDYITDTANANTAGSKLILLQHLRAVLSGCVTTYSELEATIDSIELGKDMGINSLAKWSVKEPAIAAIMGRLQNHKASLAFMLSILQWFASQSQQEAQNSIHKLQNSIDQLLQSNQELAIRLKRFERGDSTTLQCESDDVSLVASTLTSQLPMDCKLLAESVSSSVGSTFECDLQASRVYQKAIYQHSQISFESSALFSTALSIFSKLSLSQVSNISVYALPIYAIDLYNNEWYNFRRTGAESLIANRSALKASKSEAENTSDGRSNQESLSLFNDNNTHPTRTARWMSKVDHRPRQHINILSTAYSIAGRVRRRERIHEATLEPKKERQLADSLGFMFNHEFLISRENLFSSPKLNPLPNLNPSLIPNQEGTADSTDVAVRHSFGPEAEPQTEP